MKAVETFVNKLMRSSSGVLVCESIPEDIGYLEVELSRRDVTLIWLDAFQPITDYYSLVIAFHTAFHYYGVARNIDAVADYLFEAWYLPYRSCAVLLNDTEKISKDERIYSALKEILSELSKRWRMNGYSFRSILVEKSTEGE